MVAADNTCISTRSSPDNCGAVGNVCPASYNGVGQASCRNGTCRLSASLLLARRRYRSTWKLTLTFSLPLARRLPARHLSPSHARRQRPLLLRRISVRRSSLAVSGHPVDVRSFPSLSPRRPWTRRLASSSRARAR